MDAIEIFLIIAGVVLVAVTYILSERFDSGKNEIDDEFGDNVKKATKELVKDAVESELSVAIDERIEAALVELDKITNKKIMAVGNYSDDILDKINKNHEEVMFLYNMLNEKEETLKNTIRDIEALKQSIKKMTVVVNEIPAMRKQTTEQKKETVKEINRTENTQAENIINKAAAEKSKAGNDNKSNKNAEILKLYKDGVSSTEIAQTLGIGVGEVRLVIDLFKKED